MPSPRSPGSASHIARALSLARRQSLMQLPGGVAVKPVRAKSSNAERALQASLIQFYAISVSPGAALLFAVPNGEDRHPAVAAMLVGLSTKQRAHLEGDEALMPAGQGVLPGASDLVLLTAPGRCTLVEVKIPKARVIGADGRPRIQRAGLLGRMQGLFNALAVRLGFFPVVVTSLEEWADLLESRGLRLRSRDFSPVRAPEELALHARASR